MKILRNLLLVTVMSVILFTSPLAAQDSIPVERENILWSSGYWGPPGVNNPAHTLGPSWESKFMYDVLFDWNPVLDDPLVGFLGETMTWNDEGSELTITLRQEAEWSDGTPITSTDVVYTFNEVYAAEKGPLNSSITTQIASIVADGDYTVIITPNSGYEFSQSIYFTFVGRWQVLPAHVWPDVIAHEKKYGNNKYQLTNNWLDDIFPENLKVASGMYFPFSQAVDNSWSLYERNNDWWGLGVLSDELPAPNYIGMKSYPTNFAQNSEYIAGAIDWFGGYIQDIGQEIEENPYLATYYGQDEPYFASLSSMVEIVPNHNIYPLSEHWFREAMAYSLNVWDIIDIGASGYLEPARVGRIDDRSPQLEHLYDPTVQEDFGFSYDLDKATSIMNEHAVKVDGQWYTKDTPAKFRDEFADALPSQSGHNVAIGPYQIEAPSGWSDFELHMDTISKQFENIDIELSILKPTYSEFVGHSQAMNFDLLLYGLGPGLLDTALSNFNYFVGPAGRGVNTTGWNNPTYAAMIEQFETSIPGSEEEKQLAFDLQREIAEKLPSIPLFANGYWYSYNTQYWTGWPTDESNVMPPMAMWAFGTTGLLQQLLYGLDKNIGQTLVYTGNSNNGSATILPMATVFIALVIFKLYRKDI